MKNLTLYFTTIVAFILTFVSCHKVNEEITEFTEMNEIDAFVASLSKAVYNEPALRELLREEALRKFDNDYDILYGVIRNKQLDDSRTVEECLIQYEVRPGVIVSASEAHPLLTIFIPDWEGITGISPRVWDTKHPEVFVVSGFEKDCHSLWGNGRIIDCLDIDEFPSTVTLVIKDNERVRLSAQTKSGDFAFEYIAPCFDPSYSLPDTKVSWAEIGDQQVQSIEQDNYVYAYEVGNHSIIAYNMFQGNTVAKHRDYIYYNMTADSQEKTMSNNISEVIYKIRFVNSNPNGLYDDYTPSYRDPEISTEWVESMDRRMSAQELITKYWVDGSLELLFRLFTISKTGTISVLEKVRSVSFQDLFYLKKVYAENKHETWFNWHTDYRYHVTKACFEPKWYVLNESLISDWNIGEINTNLKIRVEEVDSGTTTYSDTITLTGNFAMNFKEYDEFSAGASINLDSVANISGTTKRGFEYGVSYQKSKSGTKNITYKETSDLLGESFLYYHQPIIVGTKVEEGIQKYKINVLSTGSMELMIIPKQL